LYFGPVVQAQFPIGFKLKFTKGEQLKIKN